MEITLTFTYDHSHVLLRERELSVKVAKTVYGKVKKDGKSEALNRKHTKVVEYVFHLARFTRN